MAAINLTYTKTHDESKPAGTRARSLGDDDIREKDYAIRERLAQDHCAYADESGHPEVGCHKKVTLAEVQDSDPTNYDNIGYLFLKDVDNVVELFWEDESGNVIQLTSGGKRSILSDVDGWRSGDLLLSSSTSAPTGWINKSTTYDNKFIRIGDDTPLSTGGSDTLSGNTGSHTLLTAEMPAHTHTNNARNANGWASGNFVQGSNNSGSPPAPTTVTSNATGGGGSHTHTLGAACVPAYIQLRMYQKN